MKTALAVGTHEGEAELGDVVPLIDKLASPPHACPCIECLYSATTAMRLTRRLDDSTHSCTDITSTMSFDVSENLLKLSTNALGEVIQARHLSDFRCVVGQTLETLQHHAQLCLRKAILQLALLVFSSEHAPELAFQLRLD